MIEHPQSNRPLQSDDQNEPEQGDRAAAYRNQALGRIDEIAARTKRALTERGIEAEVFFMVPGSGEAIMTFGTTADPDPSDEEWEIVSEVVCGIVREVVGVERVRTRDVACALVRQAT